MKFPLLGASLLALFLAAGCSKSAPTATSTPAGAKSYTDAQVLETFGWFIGSQTGVGELGLTKGELDTVIKGLRAAAEGKVAPHELSAVGPRIDEVLGKKQEANAKRVREKNTSDATAYFAKLKSNKSVVELPSGLRYEILKEGTGPMPVATDTVRVHYEGKFINGNVFDSSLRRGEPAEFPLNRVVAGWTEGLQKVNKGGKIRLHVPASLGYGDDGKPGMPPASTLIFEVELLEINPAAGMSLPMMKAP